MCYSLWKTILPTLRISQLPVVLCVRERPLSLSLVHISMSIIVALFNLCVGRVVETLWVWVWHLAFLGDTILQQTPSFGSHNLSAPLPQCPLSLRNGSCFVD